MYKVGDKVVYPMHGVGEIEKIEEREVLQKKQLYYFIKLNHGEMTMMVPVEQSDNLKIRPVQGKESISDVIDILEKPCEGINKDWKIRYNNNQQKLKEGSLISLSEVVRDLFHRNQIKELSRGEKKIFDSAFQLLTDELAYTDNISSQEAKQTIIQKLKSDLAHA